MVGTPVFSDRTEFSVTTADISDSASIPRRRHKDAAALNRQYTDDYFRTGVTGKVSGKSKFIASVTNSDYETTKAVLSDVKIRVYGNVAVVTELVTSAGGPKGKTPAEHVAREMVVWLKQDGVWKRQVLQLTTTPIPESAYSH
jgi:ketosteroid isomerase-like protein